MERQIDTQARPVTSDRGKAARDSRDPDDADGSLSGHGPETAETAGHALDPLLQDIAAATENADIGGEYTTSGVDKADWKKRGNEASDSTEYLV